MLYFRGSELQSTLNGVKGSDIKLPARSAHLAAAGHRGGGTPQRPIHTPE